jgi:3-phytase
MFWRDHPDQLQARSMFVRTLTALAATSVLLSACAIREVDFQGEGEGFIGEG